MRKSGCCACVPRLQKRSCNYEEQVSESLVVVLVYSLACSLVCLLACLPVCWLSCSRPQETGFQVPLPLSIISLLHIAIVCACYLLVIYETLFTSTIDYGCLLPSTHSQQMASGAQGTRGWERGPASQPARQQPTASSRQTASGAQGTRGCAGGEEDHEVHPHLVARGCGGSGSSGEHMLVAVVSACCQQR